MKFTIEGSLWVGVTVEGIEAETMEEAQNLFKELIETYSHGSLDETAIKCDIANITDSGLDCISFTSISGL